MTLRMLYATVHTHKCMNLESCICACTYSLTEPDGNAVGPPPFLRNLAAILQAFGDILHMFIVLLKCKPTEPAWILPIPHTKFFV